MKASSIFRKASGPTTPSELPADLIGRRRRRLAALASVFGALSVSAIFMVVSELDTRSSNAFLLVHVFDDAEAWRRLVGTTRC